MMEEIPDPETRYLGADDERNNKLTHRTRHEEERNSKMAFTAGDNPNTHRNRHTRRRATHAGCKDCRRKKEPKIWEKDLFFLVSSSLPLVYTHKQTRISGRTTMTTSSGEREVPSLFSSFSQSRLQQDTQSR